MKKEDNCVIDKSDMEKIKKAYDRAIELSKNQLSRVERRVEDIYYGDTPTFMEVPLARKSDQLKGADAVILGVPFGGITIKNALVMAPSSVSRPQPGSIYWRMGADRAPEYIRKYSVFYSVHHTRGYFMEIDKDLVMQDHINIIDYGDVDVVPEDAQETCKRTAEKVDDIIKVGAIPLVLGGDHTIPPFMLKSILAPRKKKIGLITFDSHLDLAYEPEYWAASPWTRVLESGKLSPKNFVEIGIRGTRNGIFAKNVTEGLGHRVAAIDEVKEKGMKEIMREALQLIKDETDGIYVSVDIDVMEPSQVPSQKAPEIWGLTIDEMMLALRMLSRENIIGFDICEYTPDYDINGMGAQFVARCVVEILGGIAIRKRDSSKD